MPAKKNQSMRSKSTTSYKKGGSIKNQKMHPLKYFNDQREKKIKEAQFGREVYDYYGQPNPESPYYTTSKPRDVSERQVKKAVRQANRVFKKMERKEKKGEKGKNKREGKKKFDNKFGAFTSSRRSIF